MSSSIEAGRKALVAWQKEIKKNFYEIDQDFQHSVDYYFHQIKPDLHVELKSFAEKVVLELEPLVIENNLAQNLPRIDHYDEFGTLVEHVVHHPSYEAAGNIIYSSRFLERMVKPGGLLEALTFMFLSSQTGEAGHNCPAACSAGIIRVLQKTGEFPQKKHFIDKLIMPSYTENFTGAQFLTEIQGGSDVGLNATEAYLDENGCWRIKGEKWFCSNANAELILVTARYDKNITGTKGLGLFLITSQLENGKRNHYTIRRLKDKLGTCSMATAEIDFHGAYAIAIGLPEEGFKLVMENVLHVSRLFNTFCVLGMGRRAYHVALSYTKHRIAFDHLIYDYPLVKENLARIKAENNALLASIFATVRLQDDFDEGKVKGDEIKLLLRSLANLNKYLSALWSVDHIHHALDMLAGNGAIESFSTIPRLLRDCIICENWEGTHNTLRMQLLKDILRFNADQIYLTHIETIMNEVDLEKKHHSSLFIALKNLKDALFQLKRAEHTLQSLQIKSVVDQMAILYAAVHLSKEAMSQMKRGGRSKFLSLEYFILLHLEDKHPSYNQNYLNLIEAIVED